MRALAPVLKTLGQAGGGEAGGTWPEATRVARGTVYGPNDNDYTGSLYWPLGDLFLEACDLGENSKARFASGATVYATGSMSAGKLAMSGVLVTLEVFDLVTWDLVATLIDGEAVDLPASTVSLATVNGGELPSLELGGVGEYAFVLTLRHANIAGGQRSVEFGFVVGDLGDITSPPGNPSITGAATPGDQQAALAVVAAAPTDIVYARFRRMVPGTAWSALSAAYSRTGSGALAVSGLTNGQAYEFEVVTKAAALFSEASRPVYAIPTDGSLADIDLIMAAAAAEVNALALQSVDPDGSAVDLAAAVETPPDFDAVDTPCVKVFPDTEEGEPARGGRNSIVYRVNLAFCQRSKTTAQKQQQARIRQTLRDHFLGKRLLALPGVICDGEAESALVDLDTLWQLYQWVSVITFEFSHARAKG